MIGILKLGLHAVKNTTRDKQFHGVWTVYRKEQGRLVLVSPFYGLTFMFASRSITEMIHLSVSELIETGEIKKLGPPENWPAERHGEVDLWLACLLEMLRSNNFTEELVENFLWYIGSVPFEEWPEEIKSLVSRATQMDKSEKYRFLTESTGDKRWAGKLLKSSQLNRSEIRKEFQGRSIPIIFLPLGGEEKGVLAQMCLLAYRQLRERGQEDDTLLGYVQEYIQGIVGYSLSKMGIKSVSARDVSERILSYLLERYSVPVSYGSFSSYIRKYAQRVINQETGSEFTMDTDFFQDSLEKREFQDWQSGEDELSTGFIEGPVCFSKKDGYAEKKYTVQEAAKVIDCREDWLYYQLRTGKIAGYEPQEIITEQEMIIRNVGNTRLDKKALKKLKELYELKVARGYVSKETKKKYPPLAERVAEERGTKLRAAQRWIKRRLDKGMTLDEILREAGIKR